MATFVKLYREQMDVVTGLGGIPIIFQAARLHGRSARDKAAIDQQISRGYPAVLAFELGKMLCRMEKFGMRKPSVTAWRFQRLRG
jgi:hypothetical protein